MKRVLSILIVLLLCISAFWGCSDESLGNGNENAEDPPNTTFDFDSYEEMINAFSSKKQNSEGYTIQGLKRLMGETYAHFVDKVKSDKSFPHPMLEGDPITYRNEEGFSNITFLGNELYNLPWIWYFPTVSTGENFYIAITYLPDGERQRNMTASEVIKELSPNSANIDNLGKQHENICNRQIALGDREVTALVIEYKEDTRDSIFFVYEDLLVMVRCNSDVWSDQWFSTLSFDTISK